MKKLLFLSFVVGLLSLPARSALCQEEPPAPSSSEEIRLTLYEVERTQTLSIPTQGMARVLVVNPIAVEVEAVTETQVTFRGLRIDSSVVHIWDASGRRTIRIVVTELASVLREQREREKEAIQRKLGLPERALKMQYRGTHRNLERGENESPRGTDEQYRVRTHQWKAQMGTPLGLLAADTYLESRRDTTLDKEVTQPRHLALALKETRLGPLGKMDIIAGDKDLYLSDFTIPGRRYRGLGLFPSSAKEILGRREPREEGLGLSLFAGEEREGYGLDLQAGQQTRKARSRLAGILLEYPLWKDFRIHTTGLHRADKGGEFKSDHVYEVGLDWSWEDVSKLDLDVARNGPEGAYQADWELIPVENVKVRNRLWRVGKDYRTVTGAVARDGQTGWRNTVDWTFPLLENRITLSSLVHLYRDRTDLNPANPRELNTLYGLTSKTRLPRRFDLEAGVSWEDTSGTAFPLVTQRAETRLSREIPVNLPWLATVSPFIGYQYSDFSKSKDIPGADATLELLRTGVRANFWKGLWGAVSLNQGWLKEHEPDAGTGPAETRPKEFTLEGGGDHTFTAFPAHLNLILRYVDVKDTFTKTRQPFTDQNQLSGNVRFTWKFGPGREWFTSFLASRQIPQTGTGSNPLVEFYLESGVRLDWDTKWAPTQYGTVTGSVFHDLNANARRDPEEPGIPGARVRVEGGPSQETGAQGAFSFRVPEGPTVLKIEWEQIPKGHYFTTGNTVERLVLPRKKVTVDFGVSTETEFRGTVFNDLDGDLVFKPGVDSPVQGVRLSVETGQSSTSGPSGHYSIRRIAPGTHTVTVDISSIPDGYQTLVPIRKTAEMKAAAVVQFDLPLKAQRVVSGSVFLDANTNGVRDNGDTGTKGVGLEADSQSALTDAEGRYRMGDLPPGSRQVRIVAETIPPGLFLRAPEAVDIEVPQGPFLRERVDFALGTEPGPPFKPPRPVGPIPAPAPKAEEPPTPPAEEPAAPTEPAVPLPEPLSPEQERIRALLEEILPPGAIPQVVDQALADRFPEIAALARAHPAIVVDRSESYEQALALVMRLVYQDATRVHYYEATFRSGWFRRAAPEAYLQVLPVHPKEDLLSLLAQILANASGTSEDEVAGRVDLDSLAEELRRHSVPGLRPGTEKSAPRISPRGASS